MIRANFSAYANYVTDSLHQWDLNQVLRVAGLNLSVAPEVHFSNANTVRAIVRQSALVSHVVTVDIPNSLLQEALTIYAVIGIYEGTVFKAIERVEIPVHPKDRPADYRLEDSDGEIYSFNRLENMIVNSGEAGTTEARPEGDVAVGKMYFDTTLAKPVWYSGAGVWVDATGAVV